MNTLYLINLNLDRIIKDTQLLNILSVLIVLLKKTKIIKNFLYLLKKEEKKFVVFLAFV